MKIVGIDHIVLTVHDIDATVLFYESVLGMSKEVFGEGRVALKFGNQKVNLHQYGNDFEPKAKTPKPGSEDLCFVTKTRLAEAMEHVRKEGVAIIEGAIARTGATAPSCLFT